MNIKEQTKTERALPRYKCHKEVYALKIKQITKANPPTIAELEAILKEGVATTSEELVGAFITPFEEGYESIPVSQAYMLKHSPKEGGYYVKYDDGYESYSPAKAFEE